MDKKKYKKPKSTIIRLTIGDLLETLPQTSDFDEIEVKRQSLQPFDDSFDDLSIAEESDYATTTNTIEVW